MNSKKVSQTTPQTDENAKAGAVAEEKDAARTRTTKEANTEPQTKINESKSSPHSASWKTILSWGITGLLVAVMILKVTHFNPFTKKLSAATSGVSSPSNLINLPEYKAEASVYPLERFIQLDTSIPQGTRQYPVKYTIEEGDSIFSIAKQFNIKPESILWANYDLLNDDPTFLSPGWKLTIPPTDGIYYKWEAGDTLQKVAEKYSASVDDIINWPSNGLDIENPVTDNLEYIMIPGGYRELKSWIVPLAFAPKSGATRVVAGVGGCEAPATGIVGSTAFQWPTGSNVLSGWDFTSYHLGIDISASEGTPVYASDSGTVIYAGWNDSGYGYLIEIDHNNGYQTLYAHLSTLYVSCGSDVYAGSMIALSGNTGHSEGAHLHFEIRNNGSFINPWYVLP